MAELHTYTCDECGKIKQETNHWFRVLVWPDTFLIEPFQQTRFDVKWDIAEIPHIRDICSEQCAVKAMSKAIGAGT